MIQDPVSKHWYTGKKVMTKDEMDCHAAKADRAWRQIEWMQRHPRLNAVRRFFGLPAPMARIDKEPT